MFSKQFSPITGREEWFEMEEDYDSKRDIARCCRHIYIYVQKCLAVASLFSMRKNFIYFIFLGLLMATCYTIRNG